jgi:hypothetical protein
MLFSLSACSVYKLGGGSCILIKLQLFAGPLLVGYKADYFDLSKRSLKRPEQAW